MSSDSGSNYKYPPQDKNRLNPLYETWATGQAVSLIKIFGNKPLALSCVEQILEVLKGDNRRKQWHEVAKAIHNA